MNLNLFLRGMKEKILATTIFAFGMLLYSWLIMYLLVFYPIKEMMTLFDKFPQEFLSLLAGGGMNLEIFSTIEGFISLEFLALWWLIIVGGYALSSAIGVVAKELEEGTLETLLSQPIKRWEIIVTRFVLNAIYLAFLSFFTVGCLAFFGNIYDIKLNISGLIIAGFAGFLFFLLMFTFTLFLSLILKDRGKAVIISLTFFIVSHLLNAFSDFTKTIERFRPLSLFNYYRPHEYLKGEFSWSHSIIFIVLIILLLIGSLLAFRKKDISVV